MINTDRDPGKASQVDSWTADFIVLLTPSVSLVSAQDDDEAHMMGSDISSDVSKYWWQDRILVAWAVVAIWNYQKIVETRLSPSHLNIHIIARAQIMASLTAQC